LYYDYLILQRQTSQFGDPNSYIEMTVFLLSIGIFGLFFILLSVRLLFLKKGEFRGTCASQSPWLNKEGVTCGYCGKTLDQGDSACGDPGGEKGVEPMPRVKSK
jgi:hypothetical protein